MTKSMPNDADSYILVPGLRATTSFPEDPGNEVVRAITTNYMHICTSVPPNSNK